MSGTEWALTARRALACIFRKAGNAAGALRFVLNAIDTVESGGPRGDGVEANRGCGLPFARKRHLDAIGVTRESDAQGAIRMLLENLQACRCNRRLQLLGSVTFQPGSFREEFRNAACTCREAGVGIELQANRFRLSRH